MLGRRDTLALAIGLLLPAGHFSTPGQAQALRPRWHAGDAPPAVEGISLGDSREHVLAVLGQPDPTPFPDDPDADPQTLRYRGGALMVAVSKTGGVSRILLNQPQGGALAGIRVGDHLGALLVSWGEPTQSRGAVGRYQIGGWTIAVRADLGAQKVLKLMLSRTPSAPPPPPAPAADTPPVAGAPQPAQ